MSTHGLFKHRFARWKGSTNIPVEYIQEHMEDDDLNSAITSPSLRYVARINSFATMETNEELERWGLPSPAGKDHIHANMPILKRGRISVSGARDELQQLKEAIVRYQQKIDPDSSPIVKVDELTSPWKDVRDAVKVAKDREDGQDKDSWSTRDSCDKIVDNISTFETWLDLLPGGDYGAVVGGVFKMVVTV